MADRSHLPEQAVLDAEWAKFKTDFTKAYKDAEEEQMRRALWEANLQMVNKHNAEEAEGKHTFTMGTNNMSDWTPEEKKKLCGFRGVVVPEDNGLTAEWEKFKADFTKVYKDAEEEQMRRALWEECRAMVNKHNAEEAEGKHTFTMGINHMSDWTPEERKKLCGLRGAPSSEN